MPHERTRILDSWYFLKLRAETLKIMRWQDHQSVPQEFWAISLVQAYVLWSMEWFVCEDMDFNFQKVRISFPIFVHLSSSSPIYPPFFLLQETLLALICQPSHIDNLPRYIANKFRGGFGQGGREREAKLIIESICTRSLGL